MKKLFTFFVFLACFLGTKAVEVVDVEVDFSKYNDISEFQFFGWGASESAKARLSIVDGCLHFHSEEATDPTWDCQFHPIGGVNAEVGVVYTLHYKIKGTVAQNVSMLGFGQTPYGQFPITTDWVEGTVDYEATDASGNLLMQCGDYVGDFDIAYLKITHEEREQRPVTWQNILTNGDAEGEFGEPACVQSKEFGMNLGDDNQPQVHAAEIVDDGGNKVFVCHAKEVNPVIVWDSDGEQWGVQHKAGDPMPDNAWQNQFWVVLPRAAKDGEQFKLSFRYKASRAAKVSTQDHTAPGSYLGAGSQGDDKHCLNFTTEWQEYSKQFSAAGTMQSIAFNLGEEIYTEDIDFFLDDVKVEEMVLEHGFFVASANTETGTVAYDFDNAVEFTDGEDDEDCFEVKVATIGKVGDKDSWVNEVMISTVRGNDKAFKAATIKATVKKPNVYVDYNEGSNGKIKLPAAGVWQVFIDEEMKQMKFKQLEGDTPKEPIVINPNPTEVVVKGKERDDLADGEEVKEEVGGTGNPWDNQFFIIANRTLNAGEETVVEFDYVASVDAKTNTQCGCDPIGTYKHWSCIGDVDFTTAEQHFTKDFTIPAEADGMNAIQFNMAVIKGACDYTIKNIVWKLKDDTESLIDQTGTKNFYVKEGAGTQAYEFGTDPDGIESVVNDTKNGSNAIYNLAGQRVSKDYKGIVIKNGNKYIAK